MGTRVPLFIRAAGQKTPVRSNSLVESVDIYPTVAALAGLPPPPDVDGYDLSPLWTEPNATIKPYAFSECVSRGVGLPTRPCRAQKSPPLTRASRPLHRYPRCASPETPWDDRTSCVHTDRTNFTVMGLSVRSDTWRCTFWMWWDGQALAGDFSRDPAAVELYAHDVGCSPESARASRDGCAVRVCDRVLPLPRRRSPPRPKLQGDDEADFNAYENVNVASSNPDVVKELLVVAEKQWGHKSAQ
jgi:hypothetical protein